MGLVASVVAASPLTARAASAPSAIPTFRLQVAATRTVTVASEPALQTAVRNADPGDTIALAPGTYSGAITINRSGTASAPITLTAAVVGTVVLTADLAMPSCGATSPDPNRTITFRGGASYWNITGLTIRGGIMILGGNAAKVRTWLNQHDDNWQARRAVPGRGSYAPSGILASTAYLQQQVRAPLRPSLNIRITDNTMTLKGIHSALNKNGVIARNRISDIACGVGPGVWLGSFSDGWQITGNTIHDVAPSSWKHYMQEGIRLGGSSAYNEVSNNLVYDLPGDGRAFTTDEDASWNTITGNTATHVAIGYNEQKSSWGNQWVGNRVEKFSTAAFSIRMMDARLAAPSMNSSSYRTVVSCNTAIDGAVAFQAGAMASSSVSNNSFTGAVVLGSNLRRYWAAEANTWNDSSRLPARQGSQTGAGC